MQRKFFFTIAWAVALLIAWIFFAPIRNDPPYDFMQFYLAGQLVSRGQISQLYHKPAYEPLVAEMRARGERISYAHYFNRPAFDAVFWVPLSWLRYEAASRLFVAANFLLLAILIWKVPIWFPLIPSFRVCLAVFMPFLWSIGIGQDTLLLTLLVAYSLYLASKGKEAPAGILLALCAFKPHLIWAMPLAFLAARRRKMLTFFVGAGLTLALVSFLAVGKLGVQEWIQLLQAPTTDFVPNDMGNFRALGLHLGPAIGFVAAFFTLICCAVILRRGSFAQKFSAVIFAALLLGPHTYGQDYSLLAIVAALANQRWMPFALLLPWPWFYPRNDMLPWIFVSLVCLGTMALPLAFPLKTQGLQVGGQNDLLPQSSQTRSLGGAA